MKTYDAIETSVNVAGIAVSVTDLNQILNLIVLVVSVASILFKAGLMVYRHIKAKNLEEAIVVVEDAQQQLEEIQEKIEDGRNQKGD